MRVPTTKYFQRRLFAPKTHCSAHPLMIPCRTISSYILRLSTLPDASSNSSSSSGFHTSVLVVDCSFLYTAHTRTHT